jgi:sortilin (neurotensin receptor 3)
VTVSLNVSRDRGCQWDPSLADPYAFVRDFSIAKSGPEAVVALVQSTDGSRQILEESTDDAATWHVAGAPIPTQTLVTVDLAPSDPSRIYVSALSEKEEGELFVSRDRGATWTRKLVPGTGFDAVPYIAAVHPSDPNKIFIRTDAYTNREIIDTADDALLYSADGGTTWTELIRRKAKLFGFALSPDASAILVGYGDPVDPSRVIEKADTGIYRSATDSFAFQRVDPNPVACLSWTATGIYVCRGGTERSFDVGFASASDFAVDAGAMTPLLLEQDVRGPLACSAGTTSTRCAGDWESTCKLLGACAHGGDAGADAAPVRRSRCGCGAIGSRTAPPFVPSLLVAAAVLFRRTRVPRSRRR